MCAKEGGHLTNIETMTEHNFLSLLLYTVDDGKVYIVLLKLSKIPLKKHLIALNIGVLELYYMNY